MAYSAPYSYPYPGQFNNVKDGEDYCKRLYAALQDRDARQDYVRDRSTDADLKALIFRPEWYGAKADGTTNDATAIQAAITAAQTAGGQVIFTPGKSYALTSDVNVTANLIIVGYGATIVENGGSINCYGSISSAQSITAAITRNDRAFTVASESAFAAGDSAYITSDWFSEFGEVESTAAGSITLNEYIHNSIDLDESPSINKISYISVKIYGLKFSSYNAASDYHLRIRYANNVVLDDCEFTGPGGTSVTFYVQDSKNVSVTGCRFVDMEYKGFRIIRSAYVSVDNCFFTGCDERPLEFQFCHNVAMKNNRAIKNEGFIFCAETSYMVSVEGNLINQIPRLYSEVETTATSRPGIFMIGVEDFSIIGNRVFNCIGEGDIYIRESNYDYDSGEPALPSSGVISGNTIIDTLTGTMSSHNGGIYAKDQGDRIIITGNIIRTVKSCVNIHGKFDVLDISNNILECSGTDSLGIYLTNGVTATTYYSNNIRVTDNYILSSAAATVALLSLTFEDTAFVSVCGNILEATGQSVNAYLIELVSRANAEFSGRVSVKDNILYADSTRRGIYLNIGSEPAAVSRLVDISGNLLNVPGTNYGGDTWAVAEFITSFTDADATPSTYGLSKCFKTANTGATTITDFDDAVDGQVINVFVADAYTTFDFTSSGLQGNHGTDWAATNGDWLVARYNGSTWECYCYGDGTIVVADDIYLPNNGVVWAKDSGGTNRGILYVTADDTTVVGNDDIEDLALYYMNRLFLFDADGEVLRIDTNGNMGLGQATFGASATKTFAIGNGTAPGAHVDNAVQVYSVDSSDATATLGLFLEQAVEDIGTFTASHKVKVKINGVEYYLSLDAV